VHAGRVIEQEAHHGAGAAAVAVPLIDLDLVRPPAAESPGPRAGRPLKAAVLATLLLLSLTAAGAPRGDISRAMTLDVSPAAAHLLAADALFVADEPADDSGTLRRYGLTGGDPRWSTATPTGVRALVLQADAGVLVAMNADETTTAVDADTGRILWHGAGSVAELTQDAVLLARYAKDRKTAVLRRLSLRDGAEVWTYPVGVDATWRVLTGPPPGRTPDRVVVILGDGTATTVRFDSGAVVARADLGIALRQWEGNFREDYAGSFTEVSAAGGSLYVVAGRDGTAALTAYDGETLTARWRVPSVPPGRVDDCGPVVCVTDLSGIGSDPGLIATAPEIVALDARTGARRWSARSWENVYPVDGDRLAALSVAADGPPRWSLLDAATGRVVTALGGGDFVGSGPGDGGRRFVHADSRRPGRVWVQAIDVTDGSSSVVGSIDQVTASCDGGGLHLICAVGDGPLTVWRLPD
jgi:outer membrane protein assembly factor BamB